MLGRSHDRKAIPISDLQTNGEIWVYIMSYTVDIILSRSIEPALSSTHQIPPTYSSVRLARLFRAMAHRGETLDKDVSCIADLKALGSRRLPPMVRGLLSPWVYRALGANCNRLLQ